MKMLFVNLIIFLIIIISCCLAQTYQLNSYPSPAYVGEKVFVELSLELPSEPKDIEIGFDFSQDLIDGNISGEGIFKDLINDNIIIDELGRSLIIQKTFRDPPGAKGKLVLPLKSNEDGLLDIALNYINFTNSDWNIVSFPDLPMHNRIIVEKKAPDPILNVSAEFRDLYPSVTKFIDHPKIFRGEPIRIGFIIHNPYDRDTLFKFDDDLSFSQSGFKFHNNSEFKNKNFKRSVKANGINISYPYYITHDTPGIYFIYPSLITFQDEEGKTYSMASDPLLIEVNIENRPAKISKMALSPSKEEIDAYILTAECEDADGYINQCRLVSSEDGEKKVLKFYEEKISLNIPFKLNTSGTHNITLEIMDNCQDITIESRILVKEESPLKRIFYLFVIGSFIIALIQLILNWAKLVLWFSNRLWWIKVLIKYQMIKNMSNIWRRFKYIHKSFYGFLIFCKDFFIIINHISDNDIIDLCLFR